MKKILCIILLVFSCGEDAEKKSPCADDRSCNRQASTPLGQTTLPETLGQNADQGAVAPAVPPVNDQSPPSQTAGAQDQASQQAVDKIQNIGKNSCESFCVNVPSEHWKYNPLCSSCQQKGMNQCTDYCKFVPRNYWNVTAGCKTCS